MKLHRPPTIVIPHRLTENLYVSEFVAAYQQLGWNVLSGPDQFWIDHPDTSVVHVQWPEELYRWTAREPAEKAAEKTIKRLEQLKARGVRIAWTVHNIAPHEFMNDPIDQRVYATMVRVADVIAHHCPYSIEALHARYGRPDVANEIVVPHGHYLGYPGGIGTAQARKQLSLASDETVFLCFGIIRAYKGLDFVLDAFDRVQVKKKRLVIAGRFQAAGRRKSLRERWFLARLRYLTRGVSLHTGVVPVDDVQVFLEAADVVVLGHTRGLNSGLVPLGMTFGKVVVGPDIGCIGWTLQQGENVVYAPGSVTALTDAMTEAAQRARARLGETNRKVATEWDWVRGAQSVLDAMPRDDDDALGAVA